MGIWTDLDLDPALHRMVTLVGGGGKTTLLYALAQEARALGYTVAVTTTTHILPHPRLCLTEAPDRALLARRGVVTVGSLGPGGRLTGPTDPAGLLSCADVVVIEGDGAKLLPLKAPEAWEPVIPTRSDAVAAVAGLDAVGQAIGAVCHRPEVVARLLDKPLTAPVTAEDVVTLLGHPLGGRKGVPAGAAFRCVLNKADTPGRLEAAQRAAALLRARGFWTAVTRFPEEERRGLCWF